MPFTYPPARRADVVDDHHGTAVADPYRWLEDPHDPETQAFVADQNAITLPHLASLPEVGRLRRRIAELWDVPRTGAPIARNGVAVWSHNDGLADQPVLMVSVDRGDPRVLLDPNTMSDDGAVAVPVWSLSPDGAHVVFTTSEAGSDRQVAHVVRTDTGEHLDDELRHLRFTSFAWHGDGFFYSRFPEVPEGDVGLFTDMSVHFHRLGADQADDDLVFANPEEPELGYDATVSHDGAWLVLTEWSGTSIRNGLLVAPLGADGPDDFVRVADPGEAVYGFVAVGDDGLLIETDLDAPNHRIVHIPFDDLTARRTVVPEGDPMEVAVARAGGIVTITLADAAHVVRRYGLDGSELGTIPLPGPGTVAEVTGHLDDPVIHLGYQSFLHPPTALRWEDGTTEVFAGAAPPLPPDDVVVERRHATSSDGAEVGMFVLRHRGTELPAPTELYGYGGFNINVTPMFNPARLAWLEAGGVVASANLRGGSEHGETWHEQGMLGAKQQVFDDFIACGEALVADGTTTPDRLGIRGGSNGGLLVTAVMLQRPELFGAVVAQVPVTDMLRYQRFTAGRYWTVEYGDAADPEAFAWLIAYSPLHNVRSGVEYPPTLVLTAETDDRVVPMHSLKFAATLQHAAGGTSERPLLVRVETRAGHGLGKPTSKLIDEAADAYGFLAHHLGSVPA
ncbi:MAG: prolyl oligopeptidase family serine peptidase [Acidimicrobiia bacterium]